MAHIKITFEQKIYMKIGTSENFGESTHLVPSNKYSET